MIANHIAELVSPANCRCVLLAAVSIFLAPFTSLAADPPNPAESLARIEGAIHIDKLGALALQHSWRYATVDSWARDAIKSIHGSKPLFMLDPVVAAVELMFNAAAYENEPVLFIKDRALRAELIAHPVELTEDERARIMRTGMVSMAFLRNPVVSERIRQLSADMLKKTAMDRLMTAVNYYQQLGGTFTVVPHPQGERDTPWYSLMMVHPMSSVSAEGLSPDQIKRVGELRLTWQKAWLARDAAAINQSINDINVYLPTLAPKDVYPSAESRRTEVSYRRMGLMRYAWMCYIACFFISIFAVSTGYAWVRALGLFLLLAALGLHGYDIGLRWAVLGRIPVANMYEAVTSSTWIGAAFGLVLELVLRKRVFLLASALLGFFALSLPELLPDAVDNRLTTMMPILDDIMLRIHTVLIISSYAVITLAFAVANCYLFVAALRDRVRAAQFTIGAQFGALGWLALARLESMSNLGPAGFITGTTCAIIGGALIATGLCGMLPARRAALAAQHASGAGPGLDASLFPVKRSLLEEFDFSQRVLLYTAAIALFVGLVLGAVWADYSWGRPWGWDPKEVFALNTWLVYAILIHIPFVTKRRALWTSVLSVIGFAVMQFNWWVVNFYVVGLHSYA